MGGAQVHSCGCIIFYTDFSNKVHQLYWNGTWNALAMPISSIVTNGFEATIDERNSRYFFVSNDHFMYYYNYKFDAVNSNGTVRIGCGSKEPNNAASLCPAAGNVGRYLTISPDGNKIFYRSTDNKMWYYYNDNENNALAYQNWYNAPILTYKNIEGPMAFVRSQYITSQPNLIYISSQGEPLYQINVTPADFPVENCHLQETTLGTAYKVSPGTDTLPLGKTPVEKDMVTQYLRVYPNPSNNGFTFSVTSMESQAIQLYVMDIAGKIHYDSANWTIKDNSYEHSWNASDLAPGYYIYYIVFSDGKQLSGKLIKL